MNWPTLEEQIFYDLAYHGDDRETELAIVRVLARLPEEVRAFALERCRFLSVGRDTWGMVLPGRVGVDTFTKRTRNIRVVLLDKQPPKSHPLEPTIAHEVAHAWLRHDRLAVDTPGGLPGAGSRAGPLVGIQRTGGEPGPGTTEACTLPRSGTPTCCHSCCQCAPYGPGRSRTLRDAVPRLSRGNSTRGTTQ
jgi:hypothetical protein